MNHRAAQLIEQLELEPHPEGGFYREIYRSAPTGASTRPAASTIYFLLPAGIHSRWHSVDADEIWHFYEGSPMELFCAAPDAAWYNHYLLGPVESGSTQPVLVIPPHHWQAARSTGDYTLVGCTVAPGFEFEGFHFLEDDTALAQKLRGSFPETAGMM